jgi:tetratricopeptide (TPR) repeat protein
MEDTYEQLSAKAFKAYGKKDYPTAFEGFQKCLELLGETGSEKDKAEMRNNISVVLIDLHKPQEAYDTAIGTELVFEELGDKKSQAMAYANIGTALSALNRKEEALTLFESSSELFKEVGEKMMRATVLKKISDLQLTTGKPFQAVASMQAAYNQKEKKSLKDKILGGTLGEIIRKYFKVH